MHIGRMSSELSCQAKVAISICLCACTGELLISDGTDTGQYLVHLISRIILRSAFYVGRYVRQATIYESCVINIWCRVCSSSKFDWSNQGWQQNTLICRKQYILFFMNTDCLLIYNSTWLEKFMVAINKQMNW